MHAVKYVKFHVHMSWFNFGIIWYFPLSCCIVVYEDEINIKQVMESRGISKAQKSMNPVQPLLSQTISLYA